jgi:hypothetical protein
MQIRSDRGWIKGGLAVLVAGALGGGVLAATGIGLRGPDKVTADGVAGKGVPAAAGSKPFDLAAGPQAPAEAAEPDPVVGEKVKVGTDGGSVTVSAVEDNVSAGRLFGAGDGHKYIAVEVRGCSGPHEKNLTFEPAYFLLRLDDGTVHDPGPGAKKPALEGGKMPPGKCLSGWVTFRVKEGSLATAVIYDGSRRLTWTIPPPKGAKPTTTTTMEPGATTAPTGDAEGTNGTTSTSSRPKTTATTAKPTPTTARSTATTAKPTTTTGKPASTGKASSTTTTGKSSSSTTTTSKSPAATTSSTSAGKSSGATTSTTGKPGPPITTPTTRSTSEQD